MAKNAIELKGSILSLTLLKIYSSDIEEAKQALSAKVEQAPDFFAGIPIVLEPKVELNDPTFLALMVDFLNQQQMIPIGIRTEDEAVKQQAEYAGLALFPKDAKKKKAKKEKPVEQKVAEPQEETLATAMVVNGAVRSGQQIYAKNRDAIIMGSVNPGAEVIADGNVHVFGKVMGKVFAGSAGEETARIFAKQINPELVCIAGMYQLAEDIDEAHKSGFVEIKLENERLVFNKV